MADHVLLVGVTFSAWVARSVLSAAGPPENLTVFGAVAVLAVPALTAWRRGRLTWLAPDVILPLALYLAVFHAPFVRALTAGRPLDSSETRVVEIGFVAACGTSWIVVAWRALGRSFAEPFSIFDDLDIVAARREYISGLAIATIGFALYALWIMSVGVNAITEASLGEVYLLAQSHTSYTFGWPFCRSPHIIVGAPPAPPAGRSAAA